MQKMNREAGQAFERAADVQSTKLNEPSDAANTMVDVSRERLPKTNDVGLMRDLF
jgi:hypothetical protein